MTTENAHLLHSSSPPFPELWFKWGHNRLSAWQWLTLAVYAGSLFVFCLGSARTLSAHESFITQIAREMLQTGDWAVPRIDGNPWLEKPPLPYWTVAALGWITGEVNAFVARLPSALAGLIGTLILADLVAKWFGSTIGLLTGLIQATTVYTITYTRLAEMDIYLWALVLGCLSVFARAQAAATSASTSCGPGSHHTRSSVCPSNSSRYLFFMLLGLTQLCKGPLFGAAMVVIPCLGMAAWSRDTRMVRWLLFWPGILLALLIATAWPAVILWQYPEAQQLWWVHTFGRITQAECINPEPIWYYATTMPWQTLPWTPAILAGVAASWRRARRCASFADRFLWVWFVLPLVALSLVSAKHHHYLIYALPPCSVWAAEGIIRSRSLITYVLTHSSGRWALLLGVTLLLAGLGYWVHTKYPQHLGAAATLSGLYLAGTLLAATSCARRRYRMAGVVLFVSLWAIFAYVHAVVMIRFDSYAPETALLHRVEMHAGASPVMIYGVYPLGDNAPPPPPAKEKFDRINPARVLVYLSRPAELHHDLHQLESSQSRNAESIIVTTVGFEPELRKLGDLERIDATPGPRSAKWGEYSHMAVYRLRWKAPQSGQAGRLLSGQAP